MPLEDSSLRSFLVKLRTLKAGFFQLQYQNSTVSTKEIVRILDHCEVQRRFSNLLDKLMLELMV